LGEENQIEEQPNPNDQWDILAVQKKCTKCSMGFMAIRTKPAAK